MVSLVFVHSTGVASFKVTYSTLIRLFISVLTNMLYQGAGTLCDKTTQIAAVEGLLLLLI